MVISSVFLKLACAVVMWMVMVAPLPLTKGAVTCGVVSTKIAPCVAYLKGSSALSPTCCAGIKGLNSVAASSTDRKTACTCLQSAAGSISGIDYAKAASLPSKCGVKIPYVISPNTNCNTVH